MEIHFYEAMNILPKDCDVVHDWESMDSIWKSVNNGETSIKEIHTTQMCALYTFWLHNGYRMFVHQGNGIVYEITLKSKGGKGNRAVRDGQNVYGLWASNVFRE